MRKEFEKALEDYIAAINKDVIDLDTQYIKDNYPDIDVTAIKKEETKKENIHERHYVYNRFVEQCPTVAGRYGIYYNIMEDRGNRVDITIVDRKHSRVVTSGRMTNLVWRPLKTAKYGYIPSREVADWINNIICDMNADTLGERGGLQCTNTD